MSGTSMDGVDASIIQTNGKSKYKVILDKYFEYPKHIYKSLTFLRDKIKIGDKVLFYHSNAKPPGAVGTAVVVKDGYPDFTAWDPQSPHPDPRSTEESPIWFMVDIKADQTFKNYVSLKQIKSTVEL